MEDTKKTIEAAKPEVLAERAPLTDEQLDQASGGMHFKVGAGAQFFGEGNSDEKIAVDPSVAAYIVCDR